MSPCVCFLSGVPEEYKDFFIKYLEENGAFPVYVVQMLEDNSFKISNHGFSRIAYVNLNLGAFFIFNSEEPSYKHTKPELLFTWGI